MLQRGTTWVAESLSAPPNASWFRPFSPTPVTPQRCQSAALTRAGRFVLLQDRKPTQEGSAQQCVRLGVALTPAPMVTFLLIPPRAQRGRRSQKSLLYSAEIITCNKMRLDLEPSGSRTVFWPQVFYFNCSKISNTYLCNFISSPVNNRPAYLSRCCGDQTSY